MKLTQFGPNEHEVSFSDGTIVFFSYSAPVAAFRPALGCIRSDQFFSKTTNRHVEHFIKRHDYKDVAPVPQAVLEHLVGS